MSSLILVIDDDLSILEVYRLILEGEGYEVITSEQVYENLQNVVDVHPHMIILDLKMGGRNIGWNFLQALKTFPPIASIPLILCTASSFNSEVEKSYLQAQHITVVYKPFDVDDLLAIVRQLLAKP